MIPQGVVPLSPICMVLQAPEQRYALSLLPTPIHRWAPPGVPDGCELWVKRDDLSGLQLSGNKVHPACWSYRVGVRRTLRSETAAV